MRLLYDIALRGYRMGIGLAAFFYPKAAAWIRGRKQLFSKLEQSNLRYTTSVLWIHAASLGEFEQGRPIIEQVKKNYPKTKILLTFFSPSGYEIRKNYSLADEVLYLPLDTPAHAKRFVQLVQPKLVIFIKYELWYHFLHELQQTQTPTILIAALFRKQQFFFQAYGRWFLNVLRGLTHIFVQNAASFELLQKHQISATSIAGDTRIDRVNTIAQQKKAFPIIEIFSQQGPILIGGSTWPADEAILQPYIQRYPKRWRYIIAPHDISEARIEQIEQLLQVPSIRYSKATKVDLKDYDVLIIDNIGMLSSLYQYAKIAYIGGGLGKGLHNTLEPIAFGLPVVFGSRYQRFEEANWLVANGGGFSIQSFHEFETIVHRLEETDFYRAAAQTALSYIEKHRGATEQIMQFIQQQQLLK